MLLLSFLIALVLDDVTSSNLLYSSVFAFIPVNSDVLEGIGRRF